MRAPRSARTLAATAALTAAIAVVMTVPTGSASAAPSTRAANQAVIAATPGCGNQITITALTSAGRTLASKALVRGRPGTQLIPRAVTSKPTRLLYSAHDCATGTARLFTQALGRVPATSELLTTSAGQGLLDATWDVMRNAPVVLMRTEPQRTALYLGANATWTPLWTLDSTTTGLYPARIDGRTGGEVLVGADVPGRGWALISVNAQGGSGIRLTGTGSISDIASTVLAQADAYATSDGTWVCDSLTSGAIADATAAGDCVKADPASARSAVFTWASSNARQYWLNIEPALGPATRTPVNCLTGDVFSCGRPTTGTTTSSGAARGSNLLWTALYDHPYDTIRAGRVPA